MQAFLIILFVILGLIVVAALAALITFICLLPKRAYFAALFSKNHLTVKYLLSAKFRKLPVNDIVNLYLKAKKAGVAIDINTVEGLTTSELDAENVVDALIMVKEAGLKFDYKTIEKVALSGRVATNFVRECLNSKSVDSNYISAMSGDLQELNIKVRLTLSVNRNNIFSTLFEDTILARAQEAVISAVAGIADHRIVLRQPLLITKAIFDAEVDSSCLYELASVDVMEVQLGKNFAFAKEKEKMEKDNILEKNRIEQRRLTAVAVEQEMKARTQELKAKLVEKEMEVPASIVKAIEEGKVDNALDYYKLQNIQADTAMRRKLAGQLNEEEENEDFDFDDDED